MIISLARFYPNCIDEEGPGFTQIDLIAHCENTTEEQYLNTLTCTEFLSAVRISLLLLHRSQQAVTEAVHRMRYRLRFPLLGIDSDNGSEFINDLAPLSLLPE